MKSTKGMLLFAALLALPTMAIAAEPADTVFMGGKVYTVNEAQPWAEAVAVMGNRIVYVGDAAGAKAFIGTQTQVIDTTICGASR